MFAAETPDAAIEAFNSAGATINAEVITLADLQQKLTAAAAAK